MTVLVTGSSGHLGEPLMRTLRASGPRLLASTSALDRSPTRSDQSPTAPAWRRP